MKLEEAIGRLRTCAQWSIDRKQAALDRKLDPTMNHITRRRLEQEIDDLETARSAASEFIEILRDRDWTGQP